jgi:hypothetical protein
MPPLHRTLLAALLTLVAPTAAAAQIVELELRDEKALHGQDKCALEVDGRWLVRGEPLYAVRPEPDGTIPWERWNFELFLADLDEPEDVPYTWKNEQREPRSKARFLEARTTEVLAIRMLAPDLTLENLRDEVRARAAETAVHERSWKDEKKGTPGWFDALYRLLEHQRRRQLLLEHHGFEPAARELDDEMRKLEALAAADARWTRGQEALASVHTVETPERLSAIATDIAGSRDRFVVQESRHLRLIHERCLDPERARALLRIGEEVVEGFRREFVDPFEPPDLVPARIFSEFWFGHGPDEDFVRYLEQYYGYSWGTPEEKARALEPIGRYGFRAKPGVFLSMYKHPGHDLVGLIAHRVGEQLAAIQFEARLRDGYQPHQAWLDEAVGMHLAFELTGARSMYCCSSSQASVSAIEVRTRDRSERPASYFLSLARSNPRSLEQLLLRDLVELGPADAGMGWSLLRFLQEDGRRGSAALHAAARLARERATFLAGLREELRGLYGPPADAGDPIADLERRWRASLPPQK